MLLPFLFEKENAHILLQNHVWDTYKKIILTLEKKLHTYENGDEKIPRELKNFISLP